MYLDLRIILYNIWRAYYILEQALVCHRRRKKNSRDFMKIWLYFRNLGKTLTIQLRKKSLLIKIYNFFTACNICKWQVHIFFDFNFCKLIQIECMKWIFFHSMASFSSSGIFRLRLFKTKIKCSKKKLRYIFHFSKLNWWNQISITNIANITIHIVHLKIQFSF